MWPLPLCYAKTFSIAIWFCVAVRFTFVGCTCLRCRACICWLLGSLLVVAIYFWPKSKVIERFGLSGAGVCSAPMPSSPKRRKLSQRHKPKWQHIITIIIAAITTAISASCQANIWTNVCSDAVQSVFGFSFFWSAPRASHRYECVTVCVCGWFYIFALIRGLLMSVD